MKGRNDTAQRRRLIGSICVLFVVLCLLFVSYGSLFNSRLRRSREDGPSDEDDDSIARRFGNWMKETGLRRNDVALSLQPSKDLDDGLDQESIDKDLNEFISSFTAKSFPVCDLRYSELIPCLDRHLHYELKLKLNLSVMEHYERHCPPPTRRLNCLIATRKWKVPILWPSSRDEVWQVNVPHTFLAQEKSDQHWMKVKGSKVIFPGGGTHFHDGADKYIASLAKMLKFSDGDLSNGGKIRTALDVGCGVASFGAFLLPLNILAMSVAPNDVHENQIQFALERGIPSTLGVLGTMRLPYPSKSFDLAHCSRCRIDWLERDGILLLEIDRLLRPGGYFAWSSPPAYRDDEEDVQIWNAMSSLVGRMCWYIAAKEGQTVIWRKPLTNSCYKQRPAGTQPPLCSEGDDPDAAWQEPMKTCISPLSEHNDHIEGTGLASWPERLISPPWRLQDLSISNNTFEMDRIAWNTRVDVYWKHLSVKISNNTLRNIMDMKAHFGGFAAALTDKPVWVMNVVPSIGPNTLKIIYDRGLIGTMHDWCEAFSTYPRTFDLLHAWTIFSDIENQGCSVEDLLLEMDRILRPMGFVIIRDKSLLVNQIRKYLTALHWDSWSTVIKPEADSISHGDETILLARKQLWYHDANL